MFKAVKDAAFGRLPRALAALAQKADELTTLYFVDLISETLGRLSSELLRGPHGIAVDRLYEQHLPDLIRSKAATLGLHEKTRASLLRNVRQPMTKIRYLLVHLGYRNCKAQLEATFQEIEQLKHPRA